jgi:hypothetical protein
LKFPRLSSSGWLAGAVLAALIFGLTSGLSMVWANGQARLVSTQEAGPYRIEFSILPAQAVVGGTHVSILLRSRETKEVLTQATVNLSATGPAGSTALGPLEAGHQSSQFFETTLPFDMVGQWEVKVEVASDLGEAAITVPLPVREPSTEINGILLAAIGVAVLALGIWTFDRVRGKKPKPASGAGGEHG